MPARVRKAAIVLALVAASSCGESPDSTQQRPTVVAAASTTPTATVPTVAIDISPSTDGLVTTTDPPNSLVETTNRPGTASPPPTGSDASGTIEWHAPADAFTIAPLPGGFVARGTPRIEDANFSPNGDALVSQVFVNVGQMLVVSLENGAYAAQQLVPGVMTIRTDILDGTSVYVSNDGNARQRAIAWQPAQDSIVWVYGTNMSDDALFQIVRSIQVAGI